MWRVLDNQEAKPLLDANLSQIDRLGAYISGYVDGEGCFSVSVDHRPNLKVGWEVRPSFAVCQKDNNTRVLQVMKRYFGCGSIRNSANDQTDHYEVRSIIDLKSKIIPHFEVFPLLSNKQRDFEHLKQVCSLVSQKKHLYPDGLRQILEVVLSMNSIGSSRRQRLDLIYKHLERVK